MIILVKLTTSKHGVYDLSEENELDTYMSREVPVPEGDEAQSLTLEELGQGNYVVERTTYTMKRELYTMNENLYP